MVALSQELSPDQRASKFRDLLTPGSLVENQYYDICGSKIGLSRIDPVTGSTFKVSVPDRGGGHTSYWYDANAELNGVTRTRSDRMEEIVPLSSARSPDSLITRFDASNRTFSNVYRWQETSPA